MSSNFNKLILLSKINCVAIQSVHLIATLKSIIQAFEYAIELATSLDAKLILVNVLNRRDIDALHIISQEDMFSTSVEKFEQDTIKK